MNPSDVKATLSFSDGSPPMDLPIYKGTVGPDVIDIRKLYGQTGKFTYDPGFLSTASCQSNITYIDGDKGELLYRGYPIEQLAENCDFLETCYLLLKGDLPSPQNPPSGCVFRTRCPKAVEKCAAEVPVRTEIAPNHFVACHFPEERQVL